jgi:hypothetical protein
MTAPASPAVLQPVPPWQRYAAVMAAVVVPAALVLVYLFPPTESSFYPPCLLFRYTGLLCPGCGSTRALHSLLHGDLRQSFAYNLFVPLLVPYLGVRGLRSWYAAMRRRPLPPWRVGPWAVWAFLLPLLAYGVLRNLPFAPFDLLAPHPVAAGAWF